ncbi:MAG TPA: hypothetical protein VJU18_19865 [Vicinamibacteria bacterium]|nr:hypothetical protein [Vicinamibacteria bacterium]
MSEREVRAFRVLFVTAAIWNMIGAGFGYFNTAFTFAQFFGRELTDPLVLAIYKGAWGTTLMYFLGYLIVAKNPVKHSGVVIVGGIGKVAFALKLLQLHLEGLAGPVVYVVVVGDFIFAAWFLWYFYRLYRTGESIL